MEPKSELQVRQETLISFENEFAGLLEKYVKAGLTVVDFYGVCNIRLASSVAANITYNILNSIQQQQQQQAAQPSVSTSEPASDTIPLITVNE